MKTEELLKEHDYYKANIESWKFFSKAYHGGKLFIKEVLFRNERETYKNFGARVNEACSFDYAQAIVDLFNFYLTEKDPIRHIGKLAEDPLWKMFEKDSDLNGINFHQYINNSQKLASIYGYMGILVNKAGSKVGTVSVQDALKKGIYPYCVQYTPPNILDWEFIRHPETHRPTLVYLKLREDNNLYHVWRVGYWEIWKFDKNVDRIPILIESGKYPIDEIPFVWMPNIRTLTMPYVGESDIKSIAYITASITRNISSGEEIIKYAGFPMFSKPMDRDDGEEDSEDTIGLTAVQEFDPELKNSKPSWIETQIEEPIDSILNWIDRKVDEAFRVAHLSGVHGQRKSNNEVASGLALRYEFQQLNSVLMQKSEALTEAEMKIVQLWLKWQNKPDMFRKEEMTISRSKNFSIDDLTIDLENAMKSMETVASKTFHIAVQNSMAKKVLPDLKDETYEIIKAEIIKNTPEPTVDDENDKVVEDKVDN